MVVVPPLPFVTVDPLIVTVVVGMTVAVVRVVSVVVALADGAVVSVSVVVWVAVPPLLVTESVSVAVVIA